LSAADLTRHAVHVLPEGELERKLKLGRPLRVKLGIDVTSPDIHIGRAIPLQRMRAFQDAGTRACSSSATTRLESATRPAGLGSGRS